MPSNVKIFKKKRGRPCKDGHRLEYLKVRLNEEEYGRLDRMAYEKETTKSDIVRKALILFYNINNFD